MKFRLNPYFLFIAICFATASCAAQTLDKLVDAGDKNFEAGDYYAASLYYRDAIKKSIDDAGLNFKLAESCRMFNDYAGAAEAYENTVKLDGPGKYPMAQFWLGEMLRSSCVCKTAQALKELKKFQNHYHKKDYYAYKVQQEIEACSWVLDHKQPLDSPKVEHLGREVNTDHSEFNAFEVYPGKLQYSALRNISEDKKHEKYLVRLYNQPSKPDKIFLPAGTDSSKNIGNGAYSPDAKRFYFTECEQKDKTTTRCDIYVSKLENSKWSAAEKLANVNDLAATNTHPSVGVDSKGNEALFFSSDRPGGQGGLDIWLSNIGKDGSYATPVNAGKTINKQGNEITPFYDVTNKKLYFSSDWHYGFGAYDIFETQGEGTRWSEPRNLLQPINTAQNDLYYSRSYDDSKAYLTSNRIGSYFIEAQTCCNDIYAYGTGKKVERKIDTASTVVVLPLPVHIDTPLIVHIDTTPVTLVPIVPAEPVKTAATTIEKMRKILPVLYFHNDEPDCCNMRDSTKLDYKQTYEAYSGQRFEYLREYARGLKGEAKVNAEKEISALFTDKVDKGFYNLVAFTSGLYDLLKGGNKVEVTIKGYCSPLNHSEYNKKLGFRRVASLKNYFFHYRDGLLLPYIESGALSLKSVSFGKETAPKGISDNRLDQRNSVYNPAAALERRVEIISVELQ